MRTRIRGGLTLVEVILATAILTVVATTVLYFARQPGDRVKQNVCDLHIKHLQLVSEQYWADYGTPPSSSMNELSNPRYLGTVPPVCPVDGRAYAFDAASGIVVPHVHVFP